MRILLFIFLFLHNIYGDTLEQIIETALRNNPSLKSISEKIDANSFKIDSSDSLQNPEISLTTNTLESSQAMSQTNITLKQKIPYLSKLSNKKEVAKADTNILFTSLDKAKSSLVYEIKSTAYKIWEIKEIYKSIEEYEKLVKKSIKLSESYSSVNNSQHIDIMNAELSLLELKVKKSELSSQIDSLYANLSYLCASDIKNLEISLSIKDIPTQNELRETLKNNFDIELKNKEIQKQKTNVNLADVNGYPDFMLIGGYSYRSEFDNFFNIGIGVTLPIYGKESSQYEQEKKLLLSKEAQKKDLSIKVENSFYIYYANMQSSYDIHKILNDEALAQVKHMLDIVQSSVSTGTNLLKQIKILEKKLQLEQKSIKAISSYHSNFAKILQLSGAMK